MKPKKCKICANKFTPTRAIQPTCDKYECKVAFAMKVALKAQENKIKREKQKRKEENQKLRTNTENWKVKLQKKVQEIARLFDKGLPCPSKQTLNCKFNGGHVFAKGREKQMRFNLHNIHRQSAQSNHWENDDVAFRAGIKNEYGDKYFEFIEWLKTTPQPIFKDIEYMSFYEKACAIANDLKKKDLEYSLQERIELRNKVNLELGIYPKEYCEYFEK